MQNQGGDIRPSLPSTNQTPAAAAKKNTKVDIKPPSLLPSFTGSPCPAPNTPAEPAPPNPSQKRPPEAITQIH